MTTSHISSGTPPVVLAMHRVNLRFGGVQALTDVSLDVRQGEIRAIIGPNGAGKSSALNVLNGFYRPTSGTVTLFGRESRGLRPAQAAQAGVARTFQNIALFKGMSTLDNLMSGRILKSRSSVLGHALYWGSSRAEEIRHREHVEAVIEFLEIEHIRRVPVGRLPYGLQKRVELGRALAMEPRILLLDEPMAGMNVEEKEDMCRFILEVNEELGTSMVLIEHDMAVVMDISDRVAVLEYGRLIADGTPDEVKTKQAVIDAYLGQEHA